MRKLCQPFQLQPSLLRVPENGTKPEKSIKFSRSLILKAAVIAALAQMPALHAEPLVTSLPTQTYDIPAGDLTSALSLYAANAGVLLPFDSTLTKGKTTQGLKGRYTVDEGFSLLLRGSGLEIINNDKGSLELRKSPKSANTSNLPLDIELEAVNVRAKRFYEIGPLPGLGLTKDQIPGNVQSITAQEIKDSHSLSLTDLMNRKLQSVTVNDYQGNPFQMDVQYRGFSAGPQIGTPQGLSVFFDGIRVNEPFGDVVNWDMIPMNALSSVDVFPGSNPIFGLNTLGGAFTMKTKDGFNDVGLDAEILTGSYGRKYLQAEAGWNNGVIGLFGAGNFFMEDGWRDNSPSKVNQFFGKASYRGDRLDINLSALLVGTDLVGNGVVPTNFYEQDRNSVFTSPDTTRNRLSQFQLSGNYFVNDNFSVTGQIYRRNSRRNQRNADVYTDYDAQPVSKNFASGDQYTCLFNSTNQYGIPDYVVIEIPDPNDFSSSPFLNELFSTGNADLSLLAPDAFNQALPDYFAATAKSLLDYRANPTKYVYQNKYPEISTHYGLETPYSNGEASYIINAVTFANDFAVSSMAPFGVDFEIFGALAGSFYYTPDGAKHLVAFKQAINGENCLNTQLNSNGEVGIAYNAIWDYGAPAKTIDGLYDGRDGYVEGIPTAVITDNRINQKVDGASFQLNWNLEKHKLMVGASIDSSYAEYNNSQRLGFFDAMRNGTLDPDRALDVFAAADAGISNNDFDGTSVTKSIYASETWTPIETVHVTGALRYNETQVRNILAARDYGQSEISLSKFLNTPSLYGLCLNGISAEECLANTETGYLLSIVDMVTSPETEKFSYYSLNPSLGATWQAKENLNLYANWSQGTRTPSVIELGCALDKTPYNTSGGTVYRSLALGRSCQLPSGLSGDPYLPQVKTETFDLGARGRWGDVLEWNMGYYRTELKDDIYLVTFNTNQNFFDSIGKTRRQGVEMGLKGDLGRTRFSLNYALTDAKFRSTFVTGGAANSSATPPFVSAGEVFGRLITVEPGDRMPGVPLHNLNASVSYDITPSWTVGLNAVMHSWSFLRGNENNDHRAGVARPVLIPKFNPNGSAAGWDTVYRQPSTNPGKIPGYAVFNFQTSYKINKEWTASMLVNNLFDKEYFSAGRLGVNPFSPSINGAVGPDGYNHNSGDWLTTNFVAPGAPRGAWFSLRYTFNPKK
ncbi:Ferric-pseudobactin BN7/BN8 receptor [Methylophilaceae bacterium]|nr:Ferric-pseudobactin BN7/BN8 receptor [Methylophilaceae bacterium]